MAIHRFPGTGTLRIALLERDSDSSEVLNENLLVDFDGEDTPVTLTLEHHSRISDATAIGIQLSQTRTQGLPQLLVEDLGGSWAGPLGCRMDELPGAKPQAHLLRTPNAEAKGLRLVGQQG